MLRVISRQLFPPGKEQPQDLLQRARNPEVLRPSKRAPRVPAELDDIVLRALASDKEDRFPSCDEMRQALQAWLAVNAPTTDPSRMSEFLQELFIEDISVDRAERESMMQNVRRRAMTLPPTDELRQMLEKSGAHRGMSESLSDANSMAETAVRTPGSVGRRSTDRGVDLIDRRKANERRAAAAAAALKPMQIDPDDSSPIIGLIVDGRYKVAEMIGEGGMGKVYLAEHVDIGKRVALKVLHPSYSRMPDLVERFRREARAASKIGHPHIVDVTDSGTTADGSAYFVMEFLEGVELGGVIEREGALEVARAVRIAQQICRALAAAHASGIIHRDLKPENIFLTIRDGTADFVKVLDFGIAKTTEAEEARERKLTSPGMAMGTPEYMAPEQAAGRPADARCDVYALGAILYEMLTGVPPYQGDNFMEILTKKATVDPVPPVHLRSTIPATVSSLVVQAMARNPDDRPSTMEAFEYELTKCLAGRGTAVAQILGMSTDQQVLATLNPGLSGRTIDSGALIRPVSSPGIALPSRHASGQFRAATPPGGLPPARATPARVATALINPSDSSTPMSGSVLQEQTFSDGMSMPMQRSGWATFAWTLLAAGVAAGLGVILFVAAGERGNRGAVPAASLQQPATAVDAGVAAAIDAGAGSGSAVRNPDGAVRNPDGAVRNPDGAGGGSTVRVRPPIERDPKPSGDVEQAAAATLKRADQALADLKFADAATGYNAVIASNHYLGQAYLGLAKTRFQARDVDGAITAANKAVRAGAGDEARKLLGHLYNKKGNYEQAQTYYEALLKSHPNDAEIREQLNSLRLKIQERDRAKPPAGGGGGAAPAGPR